MKKVHLYKSRSGGWEVLCDCFPIIVFSIKFDKWEDGIIFISRYIRNKSSQEGTAVSKKTLAPSSPASNYPQLMQTKCSSWFDWLFWS